ncbi:MAG: hypothetical protein MJ252_24190 [archaeon]|nr:hypothetical protein [archaeon]
MNIGDVDQRQTTSNLGDFRRSKGLSLKDLSKMSYYSILIGYRKNDLETKMLLNLRKSQWDHGLRMIDSKKMDEDNLKKIEEIGKMALEYSQMIENEINKTSKEIYMDSVGKFNPRDHLENAIEDLATDNLNQCLTTMLDNIIF